MVVLILLKYYSQWKKKALNLCKKFTHISLFLSDSVWFLIFIRARSYMLTKGIKLSSSVFDVPFLYIPDHVLLNDKWITFFVWCSYDKLFNASIKIIARWSLIKPWQGLIIFLNVDKNQSWYLMLAKMLYTFLWFHFHQTILFVLLFLVIFVFLIVGWTLLLLVGRHISFFHLIDVSLAVNLLPVIDYICFLK